MQEYFKYKETLINRYEWAGGLTVENSKETRKAQSTRRSEVKKGYARVIDESKWT